MLPPAFPTERLAPSPYRGFQHPPLFDPGRGHNLPLVPDPGPKLGLFEVTEGGIKDDYLVCNGTDPNTGKYLQNVAVAKPYVLQKTPFDGSTSYVGNVEVTYEYIEDFQRVARAVLAEDYPIAEVQRTTPHYFEGDILAVSKAAWGGRNATQWVDENGQPIEWIDLNFAARAWARVLFSSVTSV